MDGTLPRRTESADVQTWPQPSGTESSNRPVLLRGERISGDATDAESQRLMNMFSFQRCETLVLACFRHGHAFCLPGNSFMCSRIGTRDESCEPMSTRASIHVTIICRCVSYVFPLLDIPPVRMDEWFSCYTVHCSCLSCCSPSNRAPVCLHLRSRSLARFTQRGGCGRDWLLACSVPSHACCRKLQPSMSWQFRMTHFRCDHEEAATGSESNDTCCTPSLSWGRATPAPIPTEPTIPEGSSSQADSEGFETALSEPTVQAGVSTERFAQPQAVGKSQLTAAAVPSTHGPLAPVDRRTSFEQEEERLRHMAWRWRFTKRWCKEHTEPAGEPSRRDIAYTEALAGAPSGAWSHLLRKTSTDGGHDRESHTLSEGMLFSDCGEDMGVATGATAVRAPQWGHRRTSIDARSGSKGGGAGELGGWREGRIRGGVAV